MRDTYQDHKYSADKTKNRNDTNFQIRNPLFLPRKLTSFAANHWTYHTLSVVFVPCLKRMKWSKYICCYLTVNHYMNFVLQVSRGAIYSVGYDNNIMVWHLSRFLGFEWFSRTYHLSLSHLVFHIIIFQSCSTFAVEPFTRLKSMFRQANTTFALLKIPLQCPVSSALFFCPYIMLAQQAEYQLVV